MDLINLTLVKKDTFSVMIIVFPVPKGAKLAKMK